MSRQEKCDICGKTSNQELIPVNTIYARINTVQVSRDWTNPPFKVCYKCHHTLDEKNMDKNGVTYMSSSLPRVMKNIQKNTAIPITLIREAHKFIEYQFKPWCLENDTRSEKVKDLKGIRILKEKSKNITNLQRIAGLMWLLETRKMDEYKSELVNYINAHHSSFGIQDIQEALKPFKDKFPHYDPFIEYLRRSL